MEIYKLQYKYWNKKRFNLIEKHFSNKQDAIVYLCDLLLELGCSKEDYELIANKNYQEAIDSNFQIKQSDSYSIVKIDIESVIEPELCKSFWDQNFSKYIKRKLSIF